MIKVKICGVRDPEMARYAAQQGADFIGIIFVSGSKRYVPLEKAKVIVAASRQAGAEPVGIFADQSAKEIAAICEILDLKIVQLHGEKCRSEHGKLQADIIRFYGLYVDQEGTIQHEHHQGLQLLDPKRDYILYDGMNPGSGRAFDWECFQPNRSFRFFLAGGLNPDNVSQAVEKKQPTGVDVASGIEDPATGRQDPGRIVLFIKHAKERL